MKKLITLSALAGFCCTTYAQQLGVGGMVNHLSNGILLTYSPTWNRNWNVDLGLRIYAKVNLIGDNEQQFSYYQQGYVKSLPTYFGFNFRLTRRIFTYKFIEMGFMSNLFISFEGIRNDLGPYKFRDPDTGEWLQGNNNIIYYKSSPSTELTVGPELRITCSPKISIYGAIGYGIIYMHHSHTGWNETFNKPFISYDLDVLNWKRGSYEIVGGDKLPMISFGVKYKLK